MSKFKLIAIGAAVVAVAAGSAAFAAIPDGNGVIHACYWKGGGGPIRVIDTAAAQKCLTTENALDWNEPGPQGAKGDKGDTGDPGQQGPEGLQGFEVFSAPTPFTINAGATTHEIASCPNNKVALGLVYQSDVALGFFQSEPTPLPKSGWDLTVKNLDAQAGTVHVAAVCANAWP